MDRVKGKVAIVTGAARGLGKAQAVLLAKEGAKVVATDIDETLGKKVAEEIRREGGEAICVKHDVRNEQGWREVIEKTLSEFGRLDVLVNNAGVLLHHTIEDVSLEDWHRVLSVNLEGVFLGTKHAIGTMKKSGGGSIINISSIAGLVGMPDTSSYVASKGAVRLFTKSTALECSKAKLNYNIRVNSIHPGVQFKGPVADHLTNCPGTELHIVFFSINNNLIELVEYNPTGKRLVENRASATGSAHVCFKTENIQALHKRLSENGVRLHCTPQDLGGVWVMYFRDPDGIIIEAMQGDPLA